jgi:Ca2+-binding RTX toxin-like protein
MAGLFTDGATVSGTIAFFTSYNEIMVADGDPDSPVSLELTDSGTIDFTDQLDIRAATISAASGDDRITASIGDDLMLGNDGNDTLLASAGNDTLIGGMGDDSLSGGAGDDVFALTGPGEGHDTFLGGQGLDEIRLDTAGPLQIDWLVVGPTSGVEVLNLNGQSLGGTEGADLIDLSGIGSVIGGSAEMDLGAGDDSFKGHQGGDSVLGGDGNDSLLGNAGADWLRGGSGDDTLDGGAGADTLAIGGDDGAGLDQLKGGLDLDTVELGSDLTTLPRLILNAAASIEALVSLAPVVATGAAHDLWDLSGVTSVTGLSLIDMGAGQDSLSGSAIADKVQGGDGNDSLSGNAGDDSLAGGNQNDTLLGGLGNDSLTGEAGDDRLDGGEGSDTLAGGAGNDTYVLGVGDTLHEALDEGTDTVILQGLTSYRLGGNLENLTSTGALAVTLTGNALDNQLTGGAGNDRLDGLGGADTLRGGGGDDLYIIDSALDLVTEAGGGGTDTVRTGLASYGLGTGLETLIGTAATGQSLGGNSAANLITGLGGADVLDGAGGADTLRGGGGNDLYILDKAGDIVEERVGQGRDTVRTDLSSYTLAANVEELIGTRAGSQLLTGNSGANSITGGARADKLSGMAGRDVLTGGAGADQFIFASALGAGEVDRITDFAAGDRLVLENTGPSHFGALGLGALAAADFKLIGAGAVVDASDHILYNAANGVLYYDPDGSGAAARLAFAQLTPGTALTAADFLII